MFNSSRRDQQQNGGIDGQDTKRILPPEIIITMGSAHIKHIERASTRRIRKMTQDTITTACNKARNQNAKPISAVDDLTMHSTGRWINTFGKCLVRSAKKERISIVGGEMAQMPDTYTKGYVGIVVSVISLKGV